MIIHKPTGASEIACAVPIVAEDGDRIEIVTAIRSPGLQLAAVLMWH